MRYGNQDMADYCKARFRRMPRTRLMNARKRSVIHNSGADAQFLMRFVVAAEEPGEKVLSLSF